MKGKILIVDDHPGISLLLSEVFTYESYQVIIAKTGKEALEKIEKESFDIILLDHQLPILNGIEVIQRLEKMDISIPILLMSGMIDAIKEDAKQYPFVKKIIAKPFNLEELQTFVREYIHFLN